MSEALHLPIIDLSSQDRLSTAKSIRQACLDHGFFYLVNHGVEEELIKKVFEQSKKFFSLPVEEKNKLSIKNHRGYTAMYFEKLDTSLSSKGDSKESFYIGPLRENHLNQWPSEEDLPSWRSTMEAYHEKLLDKSRRPQVWEDVPSISGALIVNIADLMERWTNCLFR
ncbi:hypothetical protein COLO4_37116 [Corchorus olitorius]|uniref:Non-haem dioxygenase N-terminal domain-containing protein n=1 Tax=Corchorus olitorius TaxID=93759 RepID=A0A1R3G394_9ROSI|nr:hypothetical protein COLO4_37116 [Corchorus olitorius]